LAQGIKHEAVGQVNFLKRAGLPGVGYPFLKASMIPGHTQDISIYFSIIHRLYEDRPGREIRWFSYIKEGEVPFIGVSVFKRFSALNFHI